MNETDKDREILFFSLFRSLFLDLLIDITFKLFIGGFGLLHQYCNRCNDDYKSDLSITLYLVPYRWAESLVMPIALLFYDLDIYLNYTLSKRISPFYLRVTYITRCIFMCYISKTVLFLNVLYTCYIVLYTCSIIFFYVLALVSGFGIACCRYLLQAVF